MKPNAMQIVEDMAERILSGEYPPGSRLPTTLDLAVMYGVSESTASKVYLLLKLRGLAVGLPGVGVFVPDRLPPAR
jgi:DNA-binding GntR family transcriptional regulator